MPALDAGRSLGADDVKKLHRVDVRQLAVHELDDLAVVVVSRLVVTGGKHHRLHEELTVAGGYLKDASFSRETRVTQVNQWLDEASLRSRSERLFEGLEATLRTKSRTPSCKTWMHAPAIASGISETPWKPESSKKSRTSPAVLTSWSERSRTNLGRKQSRSSSPLLMRTKRTQVRRDAEALKLRLARIPARREQEIEAISSASTAIAVGHFLSPSIFLVPEFIRGGPTLSELGHHAEWLSLIDVSGPFLAEPVLKEAFPQGLEGLDSSKRRLFARRTTNGAKRSTSTIPTLRKFMARGSIWF